MARKVIIDCDPGIDDAVALMVALFNADLDVVAVTSTAGNVPGEQAGRNLQGLIERLDPPRRPRIGVGSGPISAPPVDGTELNGADGLANLQLVVSSLHQRHPAEKLICDEIRAAPEEVTIVALGPMTNIARALQRDPTIAAQIGRIVIMGGSVDCIGNITPAAEFNCHFDAIAAQTVFHSRTTKTLVPLDVTRQATFGLDLLDQLPNVESSPASQLLHQMLPFVYRSHRQALGIEGIYLNDAVALAAVLNPEFFEMEEFAGDVETSGEITLGATIFDRREHRNRATNMEVAAKIEVAQVQELIVQGLRTAIRRAH
ncbi:MAG: nucleoside hydrolase [Blastopirellula sp. JB062]